MLIIPPNSSPARFAFLRAALLVLLFVAVFSLPYLVPAPLSISRSYVAGFSNRAAILLLLGGTLLFAFFTRGELAAISLQESHLSRRALALALLVTLLGCLHRAHFPHITIPGGEALYFLNRQQMLAAGSFPYRQFEFAYGPLLLYPTLWLQRLFHLSVLHSYVLSWTVQSILGIVMLWTVVRAIDFPIRSRVTLFAFLFFAQFFWADYGGMNYTAFRAYAAAFVIVLTWAVWRHTRNPWLFALCTFAAVAFTLACSLEQAVGTALGLNGCLLLLTFLPPRRFPPTAFAVSLLASIACFVAVAPFGMLLTLRSFGSGGYSYPLLPSPSILLALFAYVVAGCLLYRAILLRRLDSVAVPLTLAGAAMLPTALGRCDILHITSAMPAFVVGAAAICAMPAVRRWWLPLAFLGLVLVPATFPRIEKVFPRLRRVVSLVSPSRAAHMQPWSTSGNQFYLSPSNVSPLSLPCDQIYFSPVLMPVPTEAFRPACLDTGYFLGYTNVNTPATIAAKVGELQQHASQPLLMEDKPLEEQLPLQLNTMESLHVEAGSPWVPHERNPPLTYAPIIDYINTHYTPGPVVASGRLRIWTPSTPR